VDAFSTQRQRQRGITGHEGGAAQAFAVAEKLGVSSVQVYRWKDDYLKNMGGTGDNGEMSPKDMAAELDLVRKQLAREKRINEILKKTVGYFAKDEE